MTLASWIKRLELINLKVGHAVSWLTLLMVLVTFLVVVLRYLFDIGSVALQESIVYMHACVFLLGAAYTLQKNCHVRVDILYQKLSAKQQAYIELFGTCFLLLPTMLFILLMSWQYVGDSWSVLEGSREAGGLPGVFLLKSVIIVMTVLMLIQGLANSLTAIQNIKQKAS